MAAYSLTEALPAFERELNELLLARGEKELAGQTAKLAIVDRCRCGDGFCASFYTLPEPEGSYGPSLRCIDLDATEGTVIIDVVEGDIAHVEVLNRGEIRKLLLSLFP